ncbi:TIGR00730 family Rossman fold protein [Pediococcus acidilactici]|nr:TIGR00730 family Rossman fold protein [Pediococcus acidilactici]KAF0495582.1 TIGR00730 family Rossman fold protein [Pediococcus acidilactici]MWB53282.1 TIGR00730 family Rossman fold protein [Pediococcus acidilactici]QAR70994.1 TIGR00730 family Rossman fold protein [Pediococcus acidilactici]
MSYTRHFENEEGIFVKITVFCGSRPGNHPSFKEVAYNIGATLAQKNVELVYGGSTSGTMGAISQGVLDHGGKVTGIYPEGLFEDELPRKNTTSFITTKTMAKRKELLINKGDAYLVLPGGLGTLEEVSQLLSDMAIGLVPLKKVGILNINGYYDHLISLLDNFVDTAFMESIYRKQLVVTDDYQKLVTAILATTDSAEISA